MFPPAAASTRDSHVFSAKAPIFDHAYYVISGRIQATSGMRFEQSGPIR